MASSPAAMFVQKTSSSLHASSTVTCDSRGSLIFSTKGVSLSGAYTRMSVTVFRTVRMTYVNKILEATSLSIKGKYVAEASDVLLFELFVQRTALLHDCQGSTFL